MRRLRIFEHMSLDGVIQNAASIGGAVGAPDAEKCAVADLAQHILALFGRSVEGDELQGVQVAFEETVSLEDGLHTFLSTKFPLRDTDGRRSTSNLEDLVGELSDFLLQSGFGQEGEELDEDSLQALHDAILEALMRKGLLSDQDLHDIAFAQTQVRNFAEKQKATMTELYRGCMRGRTLHGVRMRSGGATAPCAGRSRARAPTSG